MKHIKILSLLIAILVFLPLLSGCFGKGAESDTVKKDDKEELTEKADEKEDDKASSDSDKETSKDNCDEETNKPTMNPAAPGGTADNVEETTVDCYYFEDSSTYYAFKFDDNDDLMTLTMFVVVEMDEKTFDPVYLMFDRYKWVYYTNGLVGEINDFTLGADVDGESFTYTAAMNFEKLNDVKNLEDVLNLGMLPEDFCELDQFSRETIAAVAEENEAERVNFESYKLPELCDGQLPEEDYCFLCMATDKELNSAEVIEDELVCADCYSLLEEYGYIRDQEDVPEGPTLEELCENTVNIEMSVKGFGVITLELYPDLAPITVENFVSLAGEGFYDGLTFHRIIEDFMIQGGDPEGTGMGGSDETIKGEFTANGVYNPLSHERGVISMARSQAPNSASSQFFICHVDTPHLDGQYAAFGRVIDGIEVVDSIASVETNASDYPLETVVIEYVKVIEE